MDKNYDCYVRGFSRFARYPGLPVFPDGRRSMSIDCRDCEKLERGWDFRMGTNKNGAIVPGETNPRLIERPNRINLQPGKDIHVKISLSGFEPEK